MRDLTKELIAYSSAKKAEEINKRVALLNKIYSHIETIKSRASELDTILDNAYTAKQSGIKLGDVMRGQDYYKRHNFLANAIHHRLGFLTDNWNEPWAIATIGGGCNGDVAIIYTEGGYVSCCLQEGVRNQTKRSATDHTELLSDMDDKWLCDCEHALDKFVSDIDGFGDAFELYLLGILNKGR